MTEQEQKISETEEAEDGNAALVQFSFAYAKRHGVLLVEKDHKQSLIYRDGTSLGSLSEVQRQASALLHYEHVSDAEFNRRLSLSYQNNSTQAMQMVEGLGNDMDLASLADSVPETEDLMEQEDDAPIIKLINALLTEAIKLGSSDIHIETFESRLSVRFRVDGVLREVVQPKRELAPLLVSRIKVMAKLDIAEKRIPQDGRIGLKVGGREVDVRVSTMPSSNGERVVLRLLDKQAGRLDLEHLGMDQVTHTEMSNIIQKPHGILLVTGPTGSGKTTTLYAAMTQLNSAVRNILTVEDPIEYQLDGVGQTQVNNKVQMTFARGLRAILRQDPDVVMVGEIRDLETAEIAVQASLTGHLVMSTLHTNSAVGAVTRLHDMGIEPFLLSSSLLAVLAQRLVRTLCPDCKIADAMTTAEKAMFDLDENTEQTVYRASACESCNQLGYNGRVGIYELVVIDETIRQLIHNNASEMEIEAQARTRTPSIRQDGILKILAGETTIEEVLRVTRDE